MTNRRRIEQGPVSARGVATAMAILLALTTILHLVVGATAADTTLRQPLIAFGCVYLVAALLVRTGRNGVLAAMIFSTLGLAIGGGRYVNQGGPWALPVMLVIDIVVIWLGVIWMRRTRGIG